MYSNFCIEVDEFKFFKIIKNVLSKSGAQNTAAASGHPGLTRPSNAGDSQAETDDLASLFSKIDDQEEDLDFEGDDMPDKDMENYNTASAMLEDEDTGNNNTNASLMRLGGRTTMPIIDQKATRSEKKERGRQSAGDSSADE
jgi:hypothetical protein